MKSALELSNAMYSSKKGFFAMKSWWKSTQLPSPPALGLSVSVLR